MSGAGKTKKSWGRVILKTIFGFILSLIIFIVGTIIVSEVGNIGFRSALERMTLFSLLGIIIGIIHYLKKQKLRKQNKMIICPNCGNGQ